MHTLSPFWSSKGVIDHSPAPAEADGAESGQSRLKTLSRKAQNPARPRRKPSNNWFRLPVASASDQSAPAGRRSKDWSVTHTRSLSIFGFESPAEGQQPVI